ncbi:MAG: hypothetical protein KDD43_14950, partial [Bdellovibrionales bacterium]|nr:hypothetical protein [Bdellovibrionales bacterium]
MTLKAGKSGRVQISVQPYPSKKEEPLWAIIIRDVTLEEMLASKYRGELEQKEEFISQLQEAKKELEAYSKNLEAMVEERTAEVKAANQMLNAIMNSLGQGFLVFNHDGKCSDVFTRACLDILESSPGGKSIEEVLRLEGVSKEQFEMWRKAVFSETLPFDSLIDLAPRLFNHSSGRHITLDYYPIRKNGSGIDQLVLVATDKTSEYETSQALEIEKEHAQMTLKIFKDREQFGQFLKSTRTAISALYLQLERSTPDNFDADEAFRRLHTMEGEAGAFSAVEIRNAARACQGDLEPLRMLEPGADSSALFAGFVDSVGQLSSALDEFMCIHGEVLKALSVDGKTKVEVEEQDLRDLLARLVERGVSQSELAPIRDRYLKKSIRQILEHYNNVIQLVAEKQAKHVE